MSFETNDLEEFKRPASEDPSFTQLWSATGGDEEMVHRTVQRWRAGGRRRDTGCRRLFLRQRQGGQGQHQQAGNCRLMAGAQSPAGVRAHGFPQGGHSGLGGAETQSVSEVHGG